MSQTTKFPYDIPDNFECGCYEEVNIKLPACEFSQCLTVEEQILYLYDEIEQLKQCGDLPDGILQRIETLETEVAELETKTAKIDNIELSISNINQEISNIKVSIEVVKSDISSLTLRVDTAESNITEAKAEIAEVKSTAENSATAASAAQETANSASTTANEAKTTADNALTTANEAKTSAESVVTIANEAKTAAESAVSAASTAQTKANEAKTTAESAASAASTAQTAAENAQTAADNAASAASTAQTKANEAKTAADNAASAASTAQTTAESAASAASTAQTTAESALSKASDWKMFAFPINVLENNPNKIFLGKYTSRNFPSSTTHETFDNSNSFKNVFNINAYTVVNSNVDDLTQLNYRIYFNDTLKEIKIHEVGNSEEFDCYYEFSGLYKVNDYEYVTLSIPLEFPVNGNNDYIFEDYGASNVVIGSLPAEFYIYYANSAGEMVTSSEETSFRSITFSIGKCDSQPVLLITIPVKPTKYYTDTEMNNLYLKYFSIKSI